MTEENIKLEEALGNAQAVVPEEPVAEAPASEEQHEEKKEEQPKVTKEKKPCKTVTYFANAKNGGDLVKKCFLMLLLAVVLAYAGLMVWGLLDKYIPTFYNGAYWAVGTAAAFLLIGIVLIIVMIVRFARKNKKKK